jgi:NADH dehydrogenase
VSRALPIPGLADHGMGLKSLSEAIGLRNRVLQSLELAESTEDPVERRAALSFIFVGAGYAGLEAIAELQDFATDVLDLYPRSKDEGMRWILVEARERVMPEVNPALAEFACRELTARGIEILTNTQLEEVTDRTARLSDGQIVPCRTLVWTAGVKPHPIIAKLGLPLGQGGRITVDDRLAVEGQPGVWALGDAAGVPDPSSKGQKPSPPTAQYAIRQGKTAAQNVAAALGTGSPKRFKYKNRGVVVEMGQHKAVAETLGIRWSGWPAFIIARLYHLFTMPRIGRRARLVVDWTVGAIFGRDTAELGQLGHVSPLDPGDQPGAQAPASPDTDQQAR